MDLFQKIEFGGNVSLVILSFALVIVTWWYAKQIHNKDSYERLSKEMDLLIAPIYSKIGRVNIFLKGSPNYRVDESLTTREYFEFWDNILKYKYLGPPSIVEAINEYLKNKSDTVGDRNEDDEYKRARDHLYHTIKERYRELTESLNKSGEYRSITTKKITNRNIEALTFILVFLTVTLVFYGAYPIYKDNAYDWIVLPMAIALLIAGITMWMMRK